MHVDPDMLQRALHGELDPAADARDRAHVASCEECAGRWKRLEEEEERVRSLLETLDHAPPAVDVRAIVRAGSRPEWWRSRIAAGVAFLVVAGGLAWAIPGSPIREWVGSFPTGDPPSPARETPDEPGASASGVSVAPGDSLDVVFENPQESGTIHVRSHPGEELELRILGGRPSIRVESRRLVVANAGATSSYRIEIPASAPFVRVQVGSRTVLVKDGTTIDAAGRDSTGAYAIPLTP
jgi:hypothetical protein